MKGARLLGALVFLSGAAFGKQANLHRSADSAAFSRLADSCIRTQAWDRLMGIYRSMVDEGRLDPSPAQLRFLVPLSARTEVEAPSENGYYACLYAGRIVTRYHLDNNSPEIYFKRAIAIAGKLSNKCLKATAYLATSSFYLNVRHDLAKAYEYQMLASRDLTQNKLNGILDCSIDVNVRASVLSYYLDDYPKGIGQLNESIGILRTAGKPKDLYDLFKRRAFLQIELRDYSGALSSLDSAYLMVAALDSTGKMLGHVNAMRFRVEVGRGDDPAARKLSAFIDPNALQDGGDEYFDYLNDLIRLEIRSDSLLIAGSNIDRYESQLKPWNIQRWRKLYEAKYLLARARKNDGEALEFYQKFREYDDTIHRQRMNLVIMDQQMKYETRQKEEDLKSEKAVNHIYQWAVVSVTAMAAGIILLIVINLRRSRRSVTALTVLNREVEQQRKDLEKAGEDKDRILRTVAHDLRNPVSGIVSLTESLLEKGSTAGEQALKLVNQTSGRALLLINELLRFELGASFSPGEKRTAVLNEIVKESSALLRPQALKKAQEVKLKLGHSIPPIDADPDKISRVLQNLIGNAIKFSPTGLSIVIETSLHESEVIVSVRDKGIGIAPEELHSIFEGRKNTGRPGTAGEESFGLGLSICHEIITGYGGRIWVESEPNQGSTFRFSLPVDRKRA